MHTDNQIAGVGDGFERNSPAWIETVKKLRPDFPVYGSMGECSECLTRMIGQENTMLWMGMEPERMGAAINRVGQFYLECMKAQIQAAAIATGSGWSGFSQSPSKRSTFSMTISGSIAPTTASTMPRGPK